MKNETKINILTSAVLLGVCIALAMIAFEREEERILAQEKTWIKQGYPIGEVIKRNEKIEAIKNEIRN